MSDTPELDQVVDARRKLSAYAGFPRTYWVLYGVALVLMAGLPIWSSFLPGQAFNLQWVLLAICLAAAAYSVLQRRRSGVHLPRQISAYPSAQRPRYTVLAVTLASVFIIYALVGNGHRTVALIVLIPVAAVIFAGQLWTRARMRDDIAAGRVAL
ncbi:hypothetical protein [Pseudonocardia sp. KRD291]|uniref:hypothetical protein n=1 Tax=Pseudonocardia sp. KRD291 TaxID=2792007 RepID=UPI001C4A553F|nr:hypothetical protein [Pseudonocardia sp. KRD291]MBW0102646.1 hypothetical protein [Pseudonocardia sp. KRD291]